MQFGTQHKLGNSCNALCMGYGLAKGVQEMQKDSTQTLLN